MVATPSAEEEAIATCVNSNAESITSGISCTISESHSCESSAIISTAGEAPPMTQPNGDGNVDSATSDVVVDSTKADSDVRNVVESSSTTADSDIIAELISGLVVPRQSIDDTAAEDDYSSTTAAGSSLKLDVLHESLMQTLHRFLCCFLAVASWPGEGERERG